MFLAKEGIILCAKKLSVKGLASLLNVTKHGNGISNGIFLECIKSKAVAKRTNGDLQHNLFIAANLIHAAKAFKKVTKLFCHRLAALILLAHGSTQHFGHIRIFQCFKFSQRANHFYIDVFMQSIKLAAIKAGGRMH